jgi:hypothetical protein
MRAVKVAITDKCKYRLLLPVIIPLLIQNCKITQILNSASTFRQFLLKIKPYKCLYECFIAVMAALPGVKLHRWLAYGNSVIFVVSCC